MKGTVLVTGAGGFIGSHLTQALVRRGYSVRAFLRYNARHDIGNLELLPKRTVKRVELVFGDVRDIDTVRRAVSGCRYVFHLAALISVPYSYDAPRSFFETNVLGALNVLQASVEAGVERVVVVSTSEVYGTARSVPIAEDHPLCAQSPYAASKVAADKLAESFHLTYGLPVALIRPFNTYGPHQSARAVIPSIVVQALGSSTVKLGLASSIRDFLYVSDTVRGLMTCGLAEGAVGRTLNLATGRGVAIREVVKLVGKILDKRLRIRTESERLRPKGGEVEKLIGSFDEAKRLCDWRPLVGFEEGLRKTVEWIKDNRSYYALSAYLK